jgi:hypothetical protein
MPAIPSYQRGRREYVDIVTATVAANTNDIRRCAKEPSDWAGCQIEGIPDGNQASWDMVQTHQDK